MITSIFQRKRSSSKSVALSSYTKLNTLHVFLSMFLFITKNNNYGFRLVSSFVPSSLATSGLFQGRRHLAASGYISICNNGSINNVRKASSSIILHSDISCRPISVLSSSIQNSRHEMKLYATKSSSSTTTSSSSSKEKKKPNKTNRQKKKSNPNSNTGGLRKLPVVKSPTELMHKAQQHLRSSIRPDTSVKNARARARKHGAETMNGLTQALCIPLRDMVKGYTYEMKQLHPFERVVADLTVQARQNRDGVSLDKVLDNINEGRKEILLAGKDWTAKAKQAPTAREAMDAMTQGQDALYTLFDQLASPHVSLLLDLQKSLRTTPAVRLDTPAVVLVGSPNVGKSSIVRAISSATPEVNNYPFTTRGMTLGHVQVFWQDGGTINSEDASTPAAAIIPVDESEVGKIRSSISASAKKKSNIHSTSTPRNYAFSQLCQIMDSPGLLVRPDSERNQMEALTLAAMQHLPTAVMYVMDLSGGAGDACSSVADQLQLRRDVRKRFPRRPWIDVVSKYDLGVVDGAEEEFQDILEEEGLTRNSYLQLSIKENQNIDELREEVMRMLGEVRVVLDAMAAVSKTS